MKIKDQTSAVLGGRLRRRLKRREATKLRRKHDLCLHEDDIRIFADKAEEAEATKDAEAKLCEICGKKRLFVSMILRDNMSPEEHLENLALVVAFDHWNVPAWLIGAALTLVGAWWVVVLLNWRAENVDVVGRVNDLTAVICYHANKEAAEWPEEIGERR